MGFAKHPRDEALAPSGPMACAMEMAADHEAEFDAHVDVAQWPSTGVEKRRRPDDAARTAVEEQRVAAAAAACEPAFAALLASEREGPDATFGRCPWCGVLAGDPLPGGEAGGGGRQCGRLLHPQRAASVTQMIRADVVAQLQRRSPTAAAAATAVPMCTRGCGWPLRRLFDSYCRRECSPRRWYERGAGSTLLVEHVPVLPKQLESGMSNLDLLQRLHSASVSFAELHAADCRRDTSVDARGGSGMYFALSRPMLLDEGGVIVDGELLDRLAEGFDHHGLEADNPALASMLRSVLRDECTQKCASNVSAAAELVFVVCRCERCDWEEVVC